jgi:dTDP-4-amino-4,6-dideoxygalactose transaminase
MAENTGVPLLDLAAQYATIKDEIAEAIAGVFATQRYIMGPEVEGLEAEVAKYSGCKFGIGVSSGTDALLLSLMALGIKPDDEVITTPFTFFATGGCIHRLGAKPVFVDIEPESFNLNPELVARAVSDKTRAIMPVHLFGQCAEMDPILEVAKAHGLFVVEDAAQAIGSEYQGKRAGSLGTLGCFSFFPSKNLGACGDGGMITTNDEELAARLKIMRNHGAKPKYYHKLVGGNFRLDALQAAILRVKLRHLDDWTAARQKNAARYRELFAGCDAVTCPPELPARRHIYNQFSLRLPQRDHVREQLKARNIGCEVYYPVPLHVQDCFAELGYKPGDLPESEKAAAEALAVPIYPELTEQQQQLVAGEIKGLLS